MMHKMMKQCCAETGNLDLEKWKQFMECCAKQKVGEKESAKRKECGAQGGTTDGDERKE